MFKAPVIPQAQPIKWIKIIILSKFYNSELASGENLTLLTQASITLLFLVIRISLNSVSILYNTIILSNLMNFREIVSLPVIVPVSMIKVIGTDEIKSRKNQDFK